MPHSVGGEQVLSSLQAPTGGSSTVSGFTGAVFCSRKPHFAGTLQPLTSQGVKRDAAIPSEIKDHKGNRLKASPLIKLMQKVKVLSVVFFVLFRNESKKKHILLTTPSPIILDNFSILIFYGNHISEFQRIYS